MDLLLTIQDFWCVPENRILVFCGTPSLLVLLGGLVMLGVSE